MSLLAAFSSRYSLRNNTPQLWLAIDRSLIIAAASFSTIFRVTQSSRPTATDQTDFQWQSFNASRVALTNFPNVTMPPCPLDLWSIIYLDGEVPLPEIVRSTDGLESSLTTDKVKSTSIFRERFLYIVSISIYFWWMYLPLKYLTIFSKRQSIILKVIENGIVSSALYKIESKAEKLRSHSGDDRELTPELEMPKAERAINNIGVWIIFMPGSRVKPRIPITSKRAKWAIQRSHQTPRVFPPVEGRKTSKNSNWMLGFRIEERKRWEGRRCLKLNASWSTGSFTEDTRSKLFYRASF